MTLEIVRLSVDPTRHEAVVTGTIAMTVGGELMTLELTVPAGPCATEDLLPVLQGLTTLFVERGVARVEALGKSISCRAGCGACCRQLVPVAGAEARHLARVVAAMPEPRQSAVRARFTAALVVLHEAGLLGDGRRIREADGMNYFLLGIPCPFLEDEACSIHPDRPLSCRDYLVTSPAERCADTEDRRIDMVPLDWQVIHSVLRAAREEGWLPLVQALDERPAPPPPTRTGPDLLRALFAAIQP